MAKVVYKQIAFAIYFNGVFWNMDKKFILLVIVFWVFSCSNDKCDGNLGNRKKNDAQFHVGEIIDDVFVYKRGNESECIVFDDSEYCILSIYNNQCVSCRADNTAALKRLYATNQVKAFVLVTQENIMDKFSGDEYTLPFYILDKHMMGADNKIFKGDDFTVLCKGKRIVFIKYGALDFQDYLFLKKKTSHI